MTGSIGFYDFTCQGRQQTNSTKGTENQTKISGHQHYKPNYKHNAVELVIDKTIKMVWTHLSNQNGTQ